MNDNHITTTTHTRQRISVDMATYWLSPPARMLFLGSRKIIGLFLASSGTGQPPPPPSPPDTSLLPSSFPFEVCMTGQPPPAPVPSSLASVAGLSVPLDDPPQNQPIFSTTLACGSCVEPVCFVGFGFSRSANNSRFLDSLVLWFVCF